MNDGSRTRWNLVIIEGDENILGIASFNAVSVAVQQIGVKKISPGVYVPAAVA